jgi:hypothetical protein
MCWCDFDDPSRRPADRRQPVESARILLVPAGCPHYPAKKASDWHEIATAGPTCALTLRRLWMRRGDAATEVGVTTIVVEAPGL